MLLEIFTKPQGDEFNWAGPIVDFLNQNIVAITVALLILAAFLGIFLGIYIAKAEDSSAVANAKKRFIGLIVSVFVVVVLVWFLAFILANLDAIKGIFDGIKGAVVQNPENPSSTPSSSGQFLACIKGVLLGK